MSPTARRCGTAAVCANLRPTSFPVGASVLVALIGLIGILLQVANRPALVWMCEEDGLVESFTALFYFAAAAVFVYANRSYALRNVWLWGYALLFFMVAGEEISWGQRIVGMQTPGALAELNVQGEANLHNIAGIHGSIRMVGLLVVLAVCYAVPLSNYLSPSLRKLYSRLHHPVFPAWAIGIVTFAILFMVVPRSLFGREVFELDELGELFLSVAFLVFGTSVLRTQHAEATAEPISETEQTVEPEMPARPIEEPEINEPVAAGRD